MGLINKMPIFLDGNGTWRNVSQILINAGGVWRNVSVGLVNAGGTWRQFYGSSGGFGAPTGLSIQISSSTSLRTIWNAVTPNSGYTLTYEIYRNTTGSAPTGTTAATIPSISGTAENNTGLTSGTTYYYWVRAVQTNGGTPQKSAWSGPVSAAPVSASSKLSLSATASSGSNGGFSGTITYTNSESSTNGDFVVNLTTNSGTISPTSFIASSNTSGGSVSYTVSETSNTSYSATVTAKSEDATVSATASASYTYSSGGGGGSTTYYYAYSVCNAGNGTYLNAPTNGGTVTSLPAITNPKTSPANPYYTANTVYTTTSSTNSNTTIEYYSTISAADALSYVTNSACEVSSGGSGGGSTGGGSTGGGTSGCSSFGSGQANACSAFRPVCTNGVCTTP